MTFFRRFFLAAAFIFALMPAAVGSQPTLPVQPNSMSQNITADQASGYAADKAFIPPVYTREGVSPTTFPPKIPSVGVTDRINEKAAPETASPEPIMVQGEKMINPPSKSVKEEQEESNIETIVNTGDKALDEVKPIPPLQLNLSQFGYNFFETGPGFSPLTDIPVSADYVVGPGDTIVLTASGSLEGNWSLEVNRSGEVVLPKVGAVRVWGVPYSQLPGVIAAGLAKAYKNFQISLTMGKLRLIKVYIVGEVKNPGAYDVISLSTLVNALSAAGGPTKNGSLRKIEVKRGGSTVETIDLYDFFLKGDKSSDIRIQSGDTIHVPAIGKVAAIGGNVRRPAIYELNQEKTLKDLIALADGILPTGYLQRVQVSRISAHDKKKAADFNIDPKATSKSTDELLESVALQDMDVVRVFPIDNLLRDHVRLTGYILRPGDYALVPGMRVADLLPKDGLLPEYYGEAAEITRFSPPDLRPEKLFFNLNKALAGDKDNNLELKEFDVVKVFSRWEMQEMPKVRIAGEVQKPGEYRLFEKMTLRDLVMAAGNVRKTAFLGNAEITRTNISKDGVKSSIINVDLDEALKGDSSNNILLADLDEIVIRRLPDWKEETERYVTLQGEVRFPGTYPILKGEKLSSLLSRAGGYTDKAYLRGAKFTRKNVAEIQQKRMDEVIARTEQDIAKKQAELASVAASKEELEATKAALEGLGKNLEKLKNTKAEGRVSIALAPLEKLRQTSSDLELMGGDVLQIPQSPNAVMVFGEVYSPTTVIYEPGEKVSYYLRKAGGPNSNAADDEMYIIRADGTVHSRAQSSFGPHWDDYSKKWSFGGFNSTVLEPGDTLVVPQRLEKIAWMRDIKDIAYILGQVALTAGVVIAAGL